MRDGLTNYFAVKKLRGSSYSNSKLIMRAHGLCNMSTYLLDVLWGQPIKLIQVASTSELHENQRNDLLFFEIVPCHFCRASGVQT